MATGIISLDENKVNEENFPNLYTEAISLGIKEHSKNHKRLLQKYPLDITPEQVEKIAAIYLNAYKTLETQLEELCQTEGLDIDYFYCDLEDNWSNMQQVLEYAYHAGLTTVI